MSTIKISALPAASTIDGTNDVLPIVQSAVTNKITRNTLLGITGNPVGDSDSQVLTNKTLTTPTINGATLSGTLSGTYTIGGTPTFPSSVVTLTGSQILTNKTLTAPTITSPSVTGTVGGSATYSTPTLTQPTIADFSNATHNHSNAAGGGSTLTSPTINTAVISNPTVRQWDGWMDANESWTFANSTNITVPSDATTKYAVGDKIKLTQSATVKYFYIVAVTATNLTVTAGTDYTVANSAITANFYSHESSPLNFPQWFNFTGTLTGMTASVTDTTMKFSLNGRLATISPGASTFLNGTSNAITMTLTGLPVAAGSTTGGIPVRIRDNGTDGVGIASFTATVANISFGKDIGGASFTNSGTKAWFEVPLSYQI